LYRVLKPTGVFALFYAIKFLDRLMIEAIKNGFKYYWTMVRLDFTKATRSSFGLNNYAPIVLFYKSSKPKIRIKISDVVSGGEINYDLFFSMTKEVFDQFKPTSTTAFLVQTLTKNGDLVLDPFAGYGSIPFVCETFKRRWIAFEIDKERFEIGKYFVKNKMLPNLKNSER